MPSFQLARFPVNPDGDSMAQEMLDNFERYVDAWDISRPDRTSKGIYRMYAGHYAMRADYYFSDALRAGIERLRSLRSITKWLPTYVSPSHSKEVWGDQFFFRASGEIILDSNIEIVMPDSTVYWNIDASYRLWKFCLNCPHAMLVLYHATESKDQLLRGEILIIFETMRIRWALPEFKYHIVTPVSQICGDIMQSISLTCQS